MKLTDADYRRLLEFRDGLRRFQRWSEGEARTADLTPAQHQLLLAVRGHDGEPTVGEVADHLLLRHHSVVELVDRAERAGLVRRVPDTGDHRVVHLRLTKSGARRLGVLGPTHLEELERLSERLAPPWAGLP